MTAEGVDRGGSLGQLILWALRRWEDRPALISGEARLTYRSLADRVARAVSLLRAEGIGRGAAIGIMAPNCTDVIVATCAAMIEGVRLTPISVLASDEDLAWLAADAELDLLLVHRDAFERARAISRSSPKQPKVLAFDGGHRSVDFAAMVDRALPARLSVSAAATDDVAILGYTGGTTGKPKGVIHTHRSALAAVLMATAEWEWPQTPRVLAVTPVSHAAGILAYPTWLRGGRFHLLPGFEPTAMAAYVAEHEINATFLVPTMIYRLLEAAAAESFDLASMETILYGAAPMSVDRMVEALDRFGPIFMQLYGQTEAPTCISYLARAQHDAQRRDRLASCGMPLAGLDVALLDDTDRPVADGGCGEVCVRGPLVMQGYWKRPRESAEALRGGWLHTGDVGRFDEDGFLHLVDRKKDLIITGGLNIYPREIEDVIAAMPGVRGCAVVGLPDARWGEAVTAAVVLNPDGPGADAIISEVRTRRGPAAAPKRVVFVEALPTTPIGKLDKKALRARLVNA